MVEQQVRPWDVLNDRVLTILNSIPRDQFVPAQYTGLSYADTAIPLNATQNMMLDIQPEDNVLEIGTGSGYLTACMASLARNVDSIEIDSVLAKQAAETLSAQGITNVNLSCGNGLKIINIFKTYDIVVLTGAINELPQFLKDALTNHGKMFMVDGTAPAMVAHIISRQGLREWSDESIFETVLSPLVHGETEPEFKF